MSPELGAGLEVFNRSASEFTSIDDSAKAAASPGMTTALHSFTTAAAEVLGAELPDHFAIESLYPSGLPQVSESVVDRREAFQPVTQFLESMSENKIGSGYWS